jgi:hypothetical protein
MQQNICRPIMTFLAQSLTSHLQKTLFKKIEVGPSKSNQSWFSKRMVNGSDVNPTYFTWACHQVH